MQFRVESWRVESLELPSVWRHCAGCGAPRAFQCGERFRVNAQKKVLDVWLLYRCRQCAGTWKYPIVSRSRVVDMDPLVRAAYEADDPASVWHHAFDIARLRSQVSRVEMSTQVRIVRTLRAASAAAPGDVIRMEMAWPCALRLERVLANELHLTRGELQRRAANGSLQCSPATALALRKPVRDGQQVCFVGGIGAAGQSISAEHHAPR